MQDEQYDKGNAGIPMLRKPAGTRKKVVVKGKIIVTDVRSAWSRSHGLWAATTSAAAAAAARRVASASTLAAAAAAATFAVATPLPCSAGS